MRPPGNNDLPRGSSRARFQRFLADYRARALDAKTEAAERAASGAPRGPSTRRQYLRVYAGWLKPHAFAVSVLFAFALVVAGLQMVEPLFMRFIVDRVLLPKGLSAA